MIITAAFLIYIISVFIFIVFSAAGIYHLLRFGYAGDLTRIVIVVYCLVSISVITASAIILLPRLISVGG